MLTTGGAPPTNRLSAATKAALATIAVVTSAGIVQWLLLGQRVSPVIAVAAPLVGAPVVAWIYTRYVIVHRARAAFVAFERMAAGDLETRLPPAPDVELEPVRESFERMGAALRRLTAELRHEDAQRRRLFADLAHELATPTCTILGISEALGTPALSSTEEERAWLVESLEHEASRLHRLTRDMRDLANLDDPDFALEPHPTDVGDLARKTAERLDRVQPGAARIHCRADAARATVDPGRVEQVLVNLLTNAQRYTPPDAGIDLDVARTEAGVRIVVDDGGSGVPSDMLPRLGERLFRPDPSRTRHSGGHGLGLSIVSAIVHRHGGVLRFDRAPLGGLRVSIDLPAAVEP
jgi:two-component system sensor histidine kinase BaeS